MCTKKKMQWFGEVKEGKMVLSHVGKLIENEWKKTAHLRPYVRLDAWCVMPNHIHGIIMIDDVETSRGDVSVSEYSRQASETCAPHVSTKEVSHEKKTTKKFQLQTKTLGSIINHFKATVTKQLRFNGLDDFSWQPRYHDRVIRSPKELDAVRAYIARNPDAWDNETVPWHTDAAFYSL